MTADRILVVCHDAGGAEVISSWVAQSAAEHKFWYLLEGPARSVFDRKLHKPRTLDWATAASLVCRSDVDLVLTGTSYRAALERRAIQLARAASLPCASYLDHWSGYEHRFVLDGEVVLPTEIWVGDEHARRLAREVFPTLPVRLEPNRYFRGMVAEIGRFESAIVERTRGRRVLYVCDPTSVGALATTGDPRGFGYDEFEALAGFLKFLARQSEPIETLRLRLHPAEEFGKYDSVVRGWRRRFTIETSSEESLAPDCGWADWVVGCDTMAMVIGVLAGKQVYSCIPPGGKPLTLPCPDIVRLFA